MKIRELLNEAEGDHYLFAAPRNPHAQHPEGPMQRAYRITGVDPNYTPGKASLDQEYKETEKFTGTKIPNKQVKLDDPRN